MVDFFGLLRSDSLSCMYFIGLEVWQGNFFLATKHRIRASFTRKATGVDEVKGRARHSNCACAFR